MVQSSLQTPLSAITAAPRTILNILSLGNEGLAVRLAISFGQRDENKLTNVVFWGRYPARSGQKLFPTDPDFKRLSREWLEIRDRLVRPALRSASATNGARPGVAPAGAPPIAGPKEPPGYKVIYRTIEGCRVKRGLSRYGGGRVDRTLGALRDKGLIHVSDEELDVFQRIANVESDGQIQGLNTWDSAVVSIGFMQWTLQHGKLQEWISRVPNAFRRYGIELDASRTYLWKGERQRAIRGVPAKEDLRWDGWAQRFYLAGLDPEIIAAEVELAREWLRRHLGRLRHRLRGKRMLG